MRPKYEAAARDQHWPAQLFFRFPLLLRTFHPLRPPPAKLDTLGRVRASEQVGQLDLAASCTDFRLRTRHVSATATALKLSPAADAARL